MVDHGERSRLATMTVAVCVVTLRRPQELLRLLAALVDLRRPPGVALSFVIVDNDPAGSAKSVVAGMRARLPGNCIYALEPKPGVSQARNRALAVARPARWLAFVDDDETPAPNWLENLLREAATRRAVAVSGPVRPLFAGPVPGWLSATFELCYVRCRPGRPASELQTSNLLLDLRYLDAEGLDFDEGLGTHGGEDTDLCRAILARGGTIAWCEDAVVFEHVTQQRARLWWLLRRWARLGGTEVVLAGKRLPPPIARLSGLGKGGLRVLAGGAWLIATLPRLAAGDAEPAVRRLYTIARGVGMILAACGYIRRDYGAGGLASG